MRLEAENTSVGKQFALLRVKQNTWINSNFRIGVIRDSSCKDDRPAQSDDRDLGK